MNFNYRKVKPTEKDLILSWLKKPYIEKWFYGEGLATLVKEMDLSFTDESIFDFWVGCDEDKPFALFLTSKVEGESDELFKWCNEDELTMTLDMLIGEEDYLGKKLSSKLIDQFLDEVFPDVRQWLIDPECSNTIAIKAYKKAGFKVIGEFIPTHSHQKHCMMRLEKTLIDLT